MTGQRAETDALAATLIAMTKVLGDVSEERYRQIIKGYTPEHDDAHTVPELAAYALRYVDAVLGRRVLDAAGYREPLVKAAAVLVAAIESLDRRVTPPGQGSSS